MRDEPNKWYVRFMKYFVPLGTSRTLTRAFAVYLKEEQPKIAPLVKGESRAVRDWQQMGKEFRWYERAEAFDRDTLAEYATLVENARDLLVRNSIKAVEALVNALMNPRLQVSAAKEILDRAGLPGTTNIGIGPTSKFTADELRRAELEVADWKETH
jgi:hypothetical protein